MNILRKALPFFNDFAMNHQIAPKKEALECNACHSPTEVMDFNKLEYTTEQIKDLTKNR